MRKPAHKSRISVPATYSLRTHHVLTTYLQLTHNVLATYLQLAHRAIERCDERLFDRRRDGGKTCGSEMKTAAQAWRLWQRRGEGGGGGGTEGKEKAVEAALTGKQWASSGGKQRASSG